MGFAGSVVVTGPGGTTTTTAGDGSYSFTNLDAGTYSVSSPATASGKALETASPLTPSVTAGQTTTDVNFGYVPGGLSGWVYVDTNRNSARDSGEPGIGGVVVTGPGGTRTTAADGSYSFTNLDAGTYSVRIVNSSVLSTRPGSLSGLLPVQTYRTDASSYGGGVRIYFTDSGTLPPNGTDPSAGAVTSMVPALNANNFNYGVYPSAPAPPFLLDLAAGVKTSAATGALIVIIR